MNEIKCPPSWKLVEDQKKEIIELKAQVKLYERLLKISAEYITKIQQELIDICLEKNEEARK